MLSFLKRLLFVAIQLESWWQSVKRPAQKSISRNKTKRVLFVSMFVLHRSLIVFLVKGLEIEFLLELCKLQAYKYTAASRRILFDSISEFPSLPDSTVELEIRHHS